MPFNSINRADFALFKRALRTIWPLVGSSHADEAIAVYCGFRTYAALCAAMPDEPERLQIEPRPQALIERLEALGHGVPLGDLDRIQKLFEAEILGRIWDGIRSIVNKTSNDNQPM